MCREEPKLWRDRIISRPVIYIEHRQPEFPPSRDGTSSSKLVKGAASSGADWMIGGYTKKTERGVVEGSTKDR